MKKEKAAVLAVTLGLIMLLVTACSGSDTAKPAEKPVIKVAYLPITHSLPLLVAYENAGGEFDEFQLEPVRFSSWPEVTEALNSGQVDAAVTMFEIAIAGSLRGIPAEIQLLTHRNGDVLVSANKFDSVAELKGETLAIPHRLSGHTLYLYLALQESGLTFADVELVEMPPPEMAAALARGEISGYVVAEPFGAQAVVGGNGKVLLRAQDVWPGWICCGLVVDPKLRKEYPAANAELVSALVEAGKFIENNRDDAVAIAGRAMPIREELWRQSLEWIDYSDLLPVKEDFEKMQQLMLAVPWQGDTHTLLGGEADLDMLLFTEFALEATER